MCTLRCRRTMTRLPRTSSAIFLFSRCHRGQMQHGRPRSTGWSRPGRLRVEGPLADGFAESNWNRGLDVNSSNMGVPRHRMTPRNEPPIGAILKNSPSPRVADSPIRWGIPCLSAGTKEVHQGSMRQARSRLTPSPWFLRLPPASARDLRVIGRSDHPLRRFLEYL